MVLVIDDDPAIRELLQRSLASMGIESVTASSGEEGLRLAEELHPTLVTLDVLMPGMDGWAVLTAIKASLALKDIPVVMLTIVDEKDTGYMLGAAEYLIKPLDSERLATLVGIYRRERKLLNSAATHHILIIEDDAALRELIRRTLEQEGWSVAQAENGRQALDHVAEHRPALILLDLVLPDMDGVQIVDEVRSTTIGQSIPIVVVTAKDLSSAERQHLSGSVEQILQKGAYSRDELLEHVRTLINNRRIYPSSWTADKRYG